MPALDEVIDSIEVFMVPIMSVVATLATMGLLPLPSSGSGSEIEVENVSESDYFGSAHRKATDGFRFLQENNTNGVDDGTAFLTVLKVFLVVAGMVLSMLMHSFKMILRISSLLPSGGCCQPCITVLEVVCVCFAIVVAILWPMFAIFAFLDILATAGFVIWVKCCHQEDVDGQTIATNGNENDDTNTNESRAATNNAMANNESSMLGNGNVKTPAAVVPPVEAVEVLVDDPSQER